MPRILKNKIKQNKILLHLPWESSPSRLLSLIHHTHNKYTFSVEIVVLLHSIFQFLSWVMNLVEHVVSLYAQSICHHDSSCYEEHNFCLFAVSTNGESHVQMFLVDIVCSVKQQSWWQHTWSYSEFFLSVYSGSHDWDTLCPQIPGSGAPLIHRYFFQMHIPGQKLYTTQFSVNVEKWITYSRLLWKKRDKFVPGYRL